jgi:hypothetical protein
MDGDGEEGVDEEVVDQDPELMKDVPYVDGDEDDEDTDVEGEDQELPEEEEMPANWCGPGPYVSVLSERKETDTIGIRKNGSTDPFTEPIGKFLACQCLLA